MAQLTNGSVPVRPATRPPNQADPTLNVWAAADRQGDKKLPGGGSFEPEDGGGG
eukprot:CAMPEP_0174348306 /NCGR_PEP_ID=MMETSP0811_2-20130205/4711_1 /TAXON_ID=73025 ORGANISM="Eutreptiella gymnastica-like, Strain CCMP1594" /NCGR_SAMPLE_ID=MMETSP0811_2 /ASSEMBLY_ACC=CAM_ASM_000667 /LENGTH=53 /DNA_ID=CAMNT_0015474717 /DNA_START=217 /DNA_END=376 /DNA_ORIENTATION=-